MWTTELNSCIDLKRMAIIPVYGETGKIGQVLSQFPDNVVDEICLIVDQPTGRTMNEIARSRQVLRTPFTIIENSTRKGMTHALRQGFQHAMNLSYDVIVVLAGNNKDNPQEIPRLLKPIIRDGFDYVQGSRFLPGGRHRTPFVRLSFMKLYALFWHLLTGVHCTDVTNGFKAYKTSILRDSQINVWQGWLGRYAIEFYIHFKVLTVRRGRKERKYRFKEVHVSKVYEQVLKGGYSKIFPLKDWWDIVGTPIMLKMGVRK